jgi:hypothetical protein
MKVSVGDWYRTCQECGHEQPAKEPPRNRELRASYANTKCKACGSPALDYGTIKQDDNEWWECGS